MTQKWLPLLLFVGSALPVPAALDKPILDKPVKVEGGRVTGVPGKDRSITAFKGIPFAAPPVGDFRWRAPQPVQKWSGVRRAETFGASCIQNIVAERKPWTHEFMAHNEISEDCLHLNIWTGAQTTSEKRPVYLYIYGGGNREGSTAVPVYDGEGLAKKGVVVVTANYRLGLLGFFTHPELSRESANRASGNYAILDLIAALHWIQRNIAAFGGDPAKVTIGGQSAGAANAHVLTASPLAKGLFRGAIAQSGSSIAMLTGANSRTLQVQEQTGVKFAEAKGVKSLADLRRMSWKELVASIPGADADLLRFATVVDGFVLPAPVGEIFARGKQNDVPTITGCNKGEGGASPQPDMTAERFQAVVRQRYAEVADEMLHAYPAGGDAESRLAQNEISWDAARTSMHLWAVTRGKTAKAKAYTYFWDHVLPGPDAGKYGAFHTSEVPYAMNTLAMSDRPFTASDHQVADTMSSYWANFIATGDPNGKGLAHWPAAGEQEAVTMELGDKNAPIPVTGGKGKQALLERYFAKPRPPLPPL